jgi:hypothetical protein
LPESIINEVLYAPSASSSRKRDHPEDTVSQSKKIKAEDSPEPSTSAFQFTNGEVKKEAKTEDNIVKAEDGVSGPQKVAIPSIHEIKQTKINEIFAPVASSSKNPPTDDDKDSPIPPQCTVLSYNIGRQH